jgi:hypothetical protein
LPQPVKGPSVTKAYTLPYLLATELGFWEGTVAMGTANRLVGYLASIASASLFYLVWFVVRMPDSDVSIRFKIGLAFFFWLFEGMFAAFVLMAFPWYLAVLWRDRVHRFGLIYFLLLGAATTLVVACGTSSLSPKPLFVEDQTFREGFIIAVQRQGVGFLLTGLVFGLTFWLVSERLRHPPLVEAS